MEFIDLKTQYTQLRDKIDGNIQTVLDHGRFIMGPEVGELEQRLADFVGTKYCIGVGSGTDALMIALMALRIKPGDEVITTPFTFIATGEMIALLGAIPIFVDIDPQTYNLDPAQIEAKINAKTRAIMPVSLYGQCADMDEINALAATHDIPVIEDAAQSFGATYKGKRSCALSTISCTSFFPSKPFGCYGDGGACFTDDDALAALMQQIRVHGQDRRYHHPIIGINGRLDTLQAAILLAKFATFPDEISARAQIGARYSEKFLAASANIEVPIVREHNESVFAQYTLQVDDRDAVLAKLKDAGIPTAVHYPVPLHQQPAFKFLGNGAGNGSYPVAESASERVFSLPMHPFLDPATQDEIIDAVVAATN
ncbi:MAG: UDP-2-acetamido-2-deoxy-ribo-hexuluronate aminotransferase [Gammaproteobacteria bacterium]|jgi:UDP-2-acetamido-2-deoxy-ribo-hexuluronate aminotransferase